jgi:hypothetical protein
MAQMNLPDRKTGEALGAGLGMFGTFIAAMAFAIALPRLQVYVTFLMPALVGLILAAAGAIGPRRFGFSHKRALVGMMIAGAVIAWVGQHMFAYMQVVDALSRLGPGVAVVPGEAGSIGMQRLFELTGDTGFSGYLTYISTEIGAEHSPLGLLGKRSPGELGFVLMAVFELLVLVGVASWSILFRTRHLRTEALSQPLGSVDANVLGEVLRHLDGRRWEDAGRAIANPASRPTHTVLLVDGEITTEVRVHACDDHGQLGEIVDRRLIPVEGGRTIRRSFHETLRGKSE